MLQNTEKMQDAKEIWEFAKKLIALRESNDLSKQKVSLLKMCKDNLLLDFAANKYCFPSKITEEFANQYVDFRIPREIKFKFEDLLNAIWEKESNINYEDINALLIMLIDVALYRAFTIVGNLSHGRFLYQLNMCVILDSMIIKPDRNTQFGADIVSILTEVNEKAKLRINNIDTERIWTLAMLNYKVHLYESSIFFFEKFISASIKSKEKNIQSRIFHANIYIGYCYEKSEDFDKAIDLFEKILKELLLKVERNEENKKLINELNHGLGHFYNERAVFGHANNKSNDILEARYHMNEALSEKADYYSCYGSLFHEYGDYQTAQNIFSEATQNAEIVSNNELFSELKFYIAQTDASLSTNEAKQIKNAENNFKLFEDYCKKTYNYDGIVHARIFKIRTFLRKIILGTNNIPQREQAIINIDSWFDELTEYSLSNYASKSIKAEYDKIICILNVFKSLYADDLFEWHMEDLHYNLKKFMKFMPKDALKLDFHSETKDKEESNLYQIALGDLYVWCVSKNLQQNDELLGNLGVNPKQIISVLDKHSAHISIKGNGKPDLVILLPPKCKDKGFEQELKTIKSSVSELYFVYSPNPSGIYDAKWFEKNFKSQGKKFTCYQAHSFLEALEHAYCLRSFEILKRELLRPIPLFSLAPTHFSASYDFQLGDTLEVCFDSLDEHNSDSKFLRESLSFIDKKYSHNWLHKMALFANGFSVNNSCATGIIHICCPSPLSSIGVDDYLEYCVNDSSILHELHLPHNVNLGEYYTIKALPSYQEIFWDLEQALRNIGNPCEQDDSDCCTVFNCDSLLLGSENNISSLCRSIFKVIFNQSIEKISEIDKPFKCILTNVDDPNSQRECFIHIIILNSAEKDETHNRLCCPLKEVSKVNKDSISVFVTYSWEKPSDLNIQNVYLKEVIDFVKTLRQNGYDATLDLDMYKKTHNWTEMMTEGLQKDKIVVLLSREYKRKADDCKKSGVKFESNAIVDRLGRDRENVILAKLPSQKNIDINNLLPICFAGEDIIDLASNEKSDGYNKLWLTLDCNSIDGELPPVNSVINKGETI